MIVSLEAIFLSTFVMISQNRADAKRQVIANEQWRTVAEEDKQNVELLRLSNQILALTQEVREMATGFRDQDELAALTKEVRALRSSGPQAVGVSAAGSLATSDEFVRVCARAVEPRVRGGSAMSTAAASFESAAERQLGRWLPPWWLLLITGIGWSLVGLIMLRFDYTSVHAISLLFGFVGIAAGVMETLMIFMAAGWWKLLNAVLALAFFAAGVVAFVHPGNTFAALAAIFSFFLIFAGTFDIIMSIAARHEIEVWWLQLIGGIIEVFLGFWAAGYYGRSAVLLIAWVAAFAIIRGVRDFVLAFRVRELQHA
jgi:uncharacterized membrane protein HdeD (DUF308 family)